MSTYNAVKWGAIGVGAVLLTWLIGSTVYILYPWQSGLILQFGEIRQSNKEPGVYFKLPYQDLRIFDSRILTTDNIDTDRYLTADKENLIVDDYVKWRIVDPEKFYKKVLGSEDVAAARLKEIINRSMRDEIGKRTVKGLITKEREIVMENMLNNVKVAASEFGIEIVDVRIKRVELPSAVADNVYRSMNEERKRIANERRSTGDAEKERIKAEADKDRVVVLAEAERKSQELRGQGDALAANIYAKTYNSNKEFYDFYRSLQAYKTALGQNGDVLVLSPNSDFFRYLKNQDGGR